MVHFNLEKESTSVKTALKETTDASLNAHASPDDVLKNVDSMLTRMRGLKRKLQSCAEEEKRLQTQSTARIKHISSLYDIKSLEDVKYEEWSRTRLDRLLVDYLLRNGYKESATALAQEKNIEALVDVDTFVQMSRIKDSLCKGKVTEALAWCSENKKELRKMEVRTLGTYCSTYTDISYRVISNLCFVSSNMSSWYAQKMRRSWLNLSHMRKSIYYRSGKAILKKFNKRVDS